MMTRWEKWGLHLLTTGVSVSGLVYYWMKYFLETEDPFSVLNHPWQAGMLEVHLILSPFLLFLVGMVTSSHIAQKLKSGTRQGRRSGMLLLLGFPLMVMSGYLMQVASDPTVLLWLSNLHLASGALFFGIYLVHQLVSWSIAARNLTSKVRHERIRLVS